MGDQQKRQTYVYVAASSTGFLKVGCTHNLRKRMKQLAALHQTTMTVVAAYFGGFEEEQELHKKFAPYRVDAYGCLRKEWYADCAAIRACLPAWLSDPIIERPFCRGKGREAA